ncbi:helix-turn-helix domain-containing protein [Agaribacter marinus]|uniref:MerR family transcriptional regulator n=1 Tax=Agaribacter marinus TaxID=1431249 RepID=A0AA37WJH1_9ALTE|nr:helix-turn-helix domain-containing protein [Agaribacter marinus]GLR69770.1 MerR family transcriptional regulator [Agaribacter marinus]
MLDIGEVAKLSGLPTSTLRFYEEKRLIQSVGRNGLRRLFDHKVVEQLEFVALGRTAGFSLEDIVAMFSANGQYHVNRDLLRVKADELEIQAKRMMAISNGLRHAADCSAPSHSECPKFQKLLRVAGRQQHKNRSRSAS